MPFTFGTVNALAQSPTEIVARAEKFLDAEAPSLVETYAWFHTHPEVSFEEQATAQKFAELLKAEGYEVTQNVGGHGVVGVLRNGDGPSLMLRTDLDALPVTEQTLLPFASTATFTMPDSSKVGVMHACGHDVHMTNMVAVARYLARNRDQWQGSLMVIGQPAEERGLGAKAMLDDKLFERFLRPDFAVALHVAGQFPTGTIRLVSGPAFANVDSVDIVVKGRGGHGSAPDTTIDPIVQASELVISLQTIVSREVKPSEPAVVTVGSIHGGTKHNIIGDDCRLQLTVRSYTQKVREQVLAAIRRKANAIAQAYDAPEPEVTFSEGTPSLMNNAELTERLRETMVAAIGSENVLVDEPTMGGEDFSQYGLAGVPILMYRVGSVSKERLARFEKMNVPPPSLHSSQYYPDFEETIRTSTTTMIAAALELLAPKESAAK